MPKATSTVTWLVPGAGNGTTSPGHDSPSTRSDTAYDAPLSSVGVDFGTWCIQIRPTEPGLPAQVRGCAVAKLPIPVDGTILRGVGAVDESSVTGESIPTEKVAGDAMFAGTIVTAGLLQVTATGVGEDTTLARIIHRVEEAQFRLLTPLKDLTLYQFHTRRARDYFCPTCGILPFRRPRTAPEQWSINVRCLEGVDLDAIPVEKVFGSRLP